MLWYTYGENTVYGGENIILDLHSHVLPKIDDGAKDVEMSLEMLKESKRQGVDVLCATPHCATDKEEGITAFLEKRKHVYEKLTAAMGNSDEYPKIVLGAEVYLGCDLSELSNLHELCYEGTDYILLELPHGYKPSELAEKVYNIKIKGMKPVIAHVDRYSFYKEIIEELSQFDVVFQLNASQFKTMSGRKILRNVFRMYDKFVVSTDMHNLSDRPCNIEAAYKVASKKFSGIEDMLFVSGGECILGNKPFEIN